MYIYIYICICIVMFMCVYIYIYIYIYVARKTRSRRIPWSTREECAAEGSIQILATLIATYPCRHRALAT